MRSVWSAVLALSVLLLGPVGTRAAEENSVKAQIVALERRLEQQAAEIERLRTEQQRLLEQVNAQTRLSTQVDELPGEPSGAPAPMATPMRSLAADTASEGQSANAAEKSPFLKQGLGQRAREGLKDGLLVLGGYGSFRFEANNISGDFIPGGAAKAFTMRRFVVTTHSRFGDRLQLHSETEFERLLELELEKKATRTAGGVRFSQGLEGNNGAEIGLEQLWLQYELGRGQGLRAGLVLPPLGRFNILHDDDYWDLPRRTLVDRDAPVLPVKTAWRELGVGLVGNLGLGSAAKLDYQFYVTGGSTLDFNLDHVAQTRTPKRSKQETEIELALGGGAVDGTKNAGAVSWRVAFSPALAGEIGFSGYHAKYTPAFLPVTERVNSFGVDWKWRHRAWELEGEGIWSEFGDVDRVVRAVAQTVFHSSAETSSRETAQLENEIEVELNGLARRRYGFWTDLKYHWRPAFLKNSFLGRGFEDPQLIPIVRYERVWLAGNLDELLFARGAVTSLQFSNREQGRITLGLNYRPMQQVGFQFAYEHNHRHNGQGLIFPRVQRNSSNGFLMGMTFSF